MDESAALRKRLDPLYAGPPDEFVAGRDALAKELKAEGDADAAEAVKRLRRPSVAAALLNRVALEHAKEAKAFAGAVAKLRKAKGREALKDAARAQRDAAAKLVELAEGEGGGGPALDRVAETLQAAAADEAVEDLVLRGRLEREQRAASIGFGLDVGGAADDESARRGKGAKAVKAAKGARPAKGDEAAKGARGGAGSSSTGAVAKVPSAAEQKRERAAEKRREQARKREQRKVEKAKKALEAAVAEQVKAEARAEDAEEALVAAKADLAEAKEAAKAAASAVKDAKRELRERELADLG